MPNSWRAAYVPPQLFAVSLPGTCITNGTAGLRAITLRNRRSSFKRTRPSAPPAIQDASTPEFPAGQNASARGMNVEGGRRGNMAALSWHSASSFRASPGSGQQTATRPQRQNSRLMQPSAMSDVHGPALAARLPKPFVDHTAGVGETYRQHLRFAAGFGGSMVGGGLACLVHALLPFLFQTTGSRTVRKLHQRLDDWRPMTRVPPPNASAAVPRQHEDKSLRC